MSQTNRDYLVTFLDGLETADKDGTKFKVVYLEGKFWWYILSLQGQWTKFKVISEDEKKVLLQNINQSFGYTPS